MCAPIHMRIQDRNKADVYYPFPAYTRLAPVVTTPFLRPSMSPVPSLPRTPTTGHRTHCPIAPRPCIQSYPYPCIANNRLGISIASPSSAPLPSGNCQPVLDAGLPRSKENRTRTELGIAPSKPIPLRFWRLYRFRVAGQSAQSFDHMWYPQYHGFACPSCGQGQDTGPGGDGTPPQPPNPPTKPNHGSARER